MYDEILEIQNAYDVVANRYGHTLSLGGCLTNYQDFDYVICLTPDVVSHNRTGMPTFYLPFNDTRQLPSERLVTDAVDVVGWCMRRGNTLVHCNAGVNRSAMIVALWMVNVTGMSPLNAIQHLRAVRSQSVLSNETFFYRVVFND